MVVLELVLDRHKRGPGYWKFNASLLKNKDYVEKIDKLLDIELDQPFSSFRQKWEIIKLAIRGSTLQFSARKQKSNRLTMQVLEKKTRSLEN